MVGLSETVFLGILRYNLNMSIEQLNQQTIPLNSLSRVLWFEYSKKLVEQFSHYIPDGITAEKNIDDNGP